MRRTCVLIFALSLLFVGLRWVSETSAGARGGVAGRAGELSCYDANGDANVNLSDAVYMLNHLFLGGPAPIACAENCTEFCGLTSDESARLRELLPELEEREFGRRLAGVWLTDLEDFGLVELSLVTPEGGVVDLGSDDIDGSFLELGSMGRWELVDPESRRLKITHLSFYHDPNNRAYVTLSKLTLEVTVNEDFTRMEGFLREERYPASEAGPGQWPEVLERPGDLQFDNAPLVAERLP